MEFAGGAPLPFSSISISDTSIPAPTCLLATNATNVPPFYALFSHLPPASAGDDAHVLGSPAPTPRPSLPGGLSAEEAAHLLSGQNAALRERLHGLIQDKGALQARVDLLEAIQVGEEDGGALGSSTTP